MISLFKVQRTVAPINFFYVLGLLCVWIVQRIIESVQGGAFSEGPPIWVKTCALITALNVGAVLLTIYVLLKDSRNPEVVIVFEKPDPIMANMAIMSLFSLILRWRQIVNDRYLLLFLISVVFYCAASCFDNEKKNNAVQNS
jgi:hypothetical protein